MQPHEDGDFDAEGDELGAQSGIIRDDPRGEDDEGDDSHQDGGFVLGSRSYRSLLTFGATTKAHRRRSPVPADPALTSLEMDLTRVEKSLDSLLHRSSGGSPSRSRNQHLVAAKIFNAALVERDDIIRRAREDARLETKRRAAAEQKVHGDWSLGIGWIL
jgi:hypothetical protein